MVKVSTKKVTVTFPGPIVSALRALPGRQRHHRQTECYPPLKVQTTASSRPRLRRIARYSLAFWETGPPTKAKPRACLLAEWTLRLSDHFKFDGREDGARRRTTESNVNVSLRKLVPAENSGGISIGRNFAHLIVNEFRIPGLVPFARSADGP